MEQKLLIDNNTAEQLLEHNTSNLNSSFKNFNELKVRLFLINHRFFLSIYFYNSVFVFRTKVFRLKVSRFE